MPGSRNHRHNASQIVTITEGNKHSWRDHTHKTYQVSDAPDVDNPKQVAMGRKHIHAPGQVS
jgi:hypothetical protein